MTRTPSYVSGASNTPMMYETIGGVLQRATRDDYGSEWDAALSGKWHRYAALLKYSAYAAGRATPVTIARDTRKFWAQLEYIW